MAPVDDCLSVGKDFVDGAVDKVRQTLTNNGHLTEKELEAISRQLEELTARLEKVRSMSERFRVVVLSPQVERLVRRAGKEHLLQRLYA